MNLWIVFLTGLSIGGLTCLAVQGGLLASVIAARKEEEVLGKNLIKDSIWPVIAFLVTKLFVYTVLGFLLGAFGSVISLSDSARNTMQLIAGVYMVLIALNLLQLHPVLRYVVIQPPRFLTRLVHNQSKSKDLFAPAFLGAMTVFIPCGTTLAMEALAISTGNALSGALVMAVFITGTMPLFFILGFLTSTLSDKYKSRFFKLAAFAVLYLGITSINGALISSGSPVTLQTIAAASPVQIDLTPNQNEQTQAVISAEGKQEFNIQITSGGYSPSYIKVNKDQPVKLNLLSNNAYSCALAFRIPALGISKNLKPTGRDFVEFVPAKKGKITYTCSMGMYTGVIDVI